MSGAFLFIDQEGAVTRDLADLRMAPGLIPGLLQCVDAGYELILLSNQQLPSEAFQPLQDRLMELLASQGVTIRADYHCLHGDTQSCDCRLPKAGLLAEFLAANTLDLPRCGLVSSRRDMSRLAERLGLEFFQFDHDWDWPALSHQLSNLPRQATVRRTTKETDIQVSVDLDRPNPIQVESGIGFFDHMLEQLAKHGGFSLQLHCKGDLHIDDHHTVEDVALALGEALKTALGDKRGIGRYGFVLPMDETQAQVAIDLSGRPYSVFEGAFDRPSLGDLSTELIPHFFRSLSESLGAAIHIAVTGENDHHRVEASFKAVARALRTALQREGSELPTTKGML